MLSDMEIIQQALENTYGQVDATTYFEEGLRILMEELRELVLLRNAGQVNVKGALDELLDQDETNGV